MAQRLVLFGLGTAAVVLVSAALIAWSMWRDVEVNSQREVENLTHVLSEQTARSLDAIDLLLETTAAELLSRKGPSNWASEEFHNVLRHRIEASPQVRALLVFDAEGQLVSYSRRYPAPPLNVKLRPFYKQHNQNPDGGLFIGPPFKNSLTNEWTLDFSRPVTDENGRLIAIVYAGVEPKYYEKVYRGIDLGQGSTTVLMRDDGMILTRYPIAHEVLGQKLVQIEKLLPPGVRQANWRLNSPITGGAKLATGRRVENYPALIIVTYPMTLLEEQWLQQALPLLVAALVTAGLMVFFAWLFSRQVQAQVANTNQLRLAGSIIDTASDGIVVVDPNYTIIHVNDAYCQITGFTKEELLGQEPSFAKPGRHSRSFYDRMWASISSDGGWQGEIWDRRKNQELYPAHIAISAIRDEEGTITNYTAILTDVSAIKQAESEVARLSHYDPLTELPNRALLMDRLNQAIAQSKGDSSKETAFLVVDLDDFKRVNDTLGHLAGDDLLTEASQRLKAVLPDRDTVGRLGGDEFGIILREHNVAIHAEAIALAILESFAKPVLLDQSEIVATASIGIAVHPTDGDTPQSLFKNADTAMYQAKQLGRDSFCFFSNDMNDMAAERLALEHDLRRAIERQELVLFYQPIVDLQEGRLTGAEALIRWNHAERGMINPGLFIPLAESTGLINAIGAWVIATAATQLRRWRREGLYLDYITCNVSMRQFRGPELMAVTREVMAAGDLEPGALVYEITESLLMEDDRDTLERLIQLRQQGIRFAVDDFGTGYSSLSYIKRFPVDSLKVDRSFVRDLPDDQDDAALIQAILAMAKSLGLVVIAEGIEEQAQMDFLTQKGCDKGQGFFLSRPVPPDEFTDPMAKTAAQ